MRDAIRSGRPTQQGPVGSSFCAPFPKGEACNYNKAAILYCWLPWKVCILLGRAAKAHTPCWPQDTKIDQSSGSAGVDWHSASPVCVVVEVDGVKKCVYSYRMNTQSTHTGEVKQLEGVLKKKVYREWVSDLETGQWTHPANHISWNRQQRRRERMRREDKGRRRGKVRESRGIVSVHLCVFFSVWSECSHVLKCVSWLLWGYGSW